MSEAKAKVDASWDSPSGHVYTWRWALGKSNAAFYGAFVCRKPTWISWKALPHILGFAMEREPAEKLYADGKLSNDAIRVVRSFEGTNGVQSTKEIRQRAGFPTGKAERACYLKAIEELDSRLMLAKVFGAEADSDDMNHALVRTKYSDFVDAGLRVSPETALVNFLREYLSQSIFIDTKVFSRNLRISPALIGSAIIELDKSKKATLCDGYLVCQESR